MAVAHRKKLERWKQEAALIQKALEPQDKRVVAANLLVLRKLNLIGETKYPRLIEYSENALSIPGFGGAVLRDRIVTIAEVKRVLKERGKYKGDDMDDTDSRAFRWALAMFQMDYPQIEPDGLLGPKTLRALAEARPEAFQN